MEDLEDTQALNDRLREMVNKSSVDAVDKANAERKQTLRDCEKKIKEIKSQSIHETYEAHEKQRLAESEAKAAKETLKRKTSLYLGLLTFTLLCCGIMNEQVRTDFVDLIIAVASSIADFIAIYVPWLSSFSNKMEWYWAWLLRISITVLILAGCFGIGAGIVAIYHKYKERWCTLSFKVLIGSLAVITVFAEPIRYFIPINLIPLFIGTQIAYLFILWYLDGYYDNRYRKDEWERIQND